MRICATCWRDCHCSLLAGSANSCRIAGPQFRLTTNLRLGRQYGFTVCLLGSAMACKKSAELGTPPQSSGGVAPAPPTQNGSVNPGTGASVFSTLMRCSQ